MSRMTAWLKQIFTSQAPATLDPPTSHEQFQENQAWPQPEAVSPWLDRSNALSEIQAKLDRGEIDSDTAEKLSYWHKNGYLVLPKLIDDRRLDLVMEEFERFWTEQTVIGGHHRPLQRDAHGHFEPPINVHMQSDVIKDVFLDRQILKWLGLILGRDVYGCQTINFFKGTQRALHHDHIHMTTRPYGFLAAAWVAFEDIDARSGPLLYVPGSHRLRYLEAASLTGSKDSSDEVQDLLAERMRENGLPTEKFIARKGDVFLWHANLIHGGALVEDPTLSRKSMACHYIGFDVDYYHDLSGTVRDPSDVLYYKGAPYLPEYYDKNGHFVPSRKALLERS